MAKKKSMQCPLCGHRAFDISDNYSGQIEVDLKCPHCKNIVTISCATMNKKEIRSLTPLRQRTEL